MFGGKAILGSWGRIAMRWMMRVFAGGGEGGKYHTGPSGRCSRQKTGNEGGFVSLFSRGACLAFAEVVSKILGTLSELEETDEMAEKNFLF
jgi:hypothetical protein